MGFWIWGVQAALSAGTLAVGRPWTVYASGRRYPSHVRAHPLFAAANRRITAGWTAYFAAAAVVTGVVGPLASIAFVVPTPLLGWGSYRYGDRFAAARVRQASAKGEAMSGNHQDDLRSLIDGKTDDEILEATLATSGSYHAFVDMTMKGMVDAFEPDAAEDCVIGYEITSPEGVFAYRIEVDGTTIVVDERPPDGARVVLGLGLPDFLRLINGLLDGTQAFIQGRLKLRGDVMFAPQIERMFRRA